MLGDMCLYGAFFKNVPKYNFTQVLHQEHLGNINNLHF